MFKKVFALLASAALVSSLALMASCSAPEEASSDAPDQQSVQKTVRTVVDLEGNELQVPSEINTIAVLAPSINQVVVEAGFGDKIVAVDTQSAALDGYNKEVPQFDLLTPDNEALAALSPDIVFVSGISMAHGENPFQPLIDLGVTVVNVPTAASIDDIRKGVTFVCDVLGAQDKGAEMVAGMDATIDEVKKISNTIPEEERKSVYFEIAPAPQPYSFGSGVYLNELIETIGAENVFADQPGWLRVEVESAVATNPDVILTNVTYIDDPVGEVLSRSGWEAVNAVKSESVYPIDNFASSLPNHHVADALKQMAEAVYPEYYAF